jgi:hypothetical protein
METAKRLLGIACNAIPITTAHIAAVLVRSLPRRWDHLASSAVRRMEAVSPMSGEATRPHRREDGWLTRADIRYDTDAERMCRVLIGLVERMGASVDLTRAVVLLSQARDAIADHVEMDLCHNGHPFEPGIDVDMTGEGRTPDARWCNVCGDTRGWLVGPKGEAKRVAARSDAAAVVGGEQHGE